MEKQFDAISLGEVMLRFTPVGRERLCRATTLDSRAGGSELNVMAGVAALGLKTAFATKLPVNAIRDYITGQMRTLGVDDCYVIDDTEEGARVGTYYMETGATPRKPSVVYDRKHSSVTRFRAEELPDSIYTNTKLFHTSGITLALSDEVCKNATSPHCFHAGAEKPRSPPLQCPRRFFPPSAYRLSYSFQLSSHY